MSSAGLLYLLICLLFQPWEDKCQCGDHDMKSGIVQIYQLDENAAYQDETKIPFKVKMPLCLGALISHKHVLTTKLCFGEYLRQVAAKMPFEQQESCHLYSEFTKN